MKMHVKGILFLLIYVLSHAMFVGLTLLLVCEMGLKVNME